MLKNLLANKKLLATIAVGVVIIAGVVIATVINRDSGEPPKKGVGSVLGEEKDDAQDEPYDGEGLEIMDEIDGTVDSVDGSGDWDTQSDDANQEANDAESAGNNAEDSDTESDDNNAQDSDEDILIDDRVWGRPS